MPDSVLGPRDSAMNKTHCLCGACTLAKKSKKEGEG